MVAALSPHHGDGATPSAHKKSGRPAPSPMARAGRPLSLLVETWEGPPPASLHFAADPLMTSDAPVTRRGLYRVVRKDRPYWQLFRTPPSSKPRNSF